MLSPDLFSLRCDVWCVLFRQSESWFYNFFVIYKYLFVAFTLKRLSVIDYCFSFDRMVGVKGVNNDRISIQRDRQDLT